MNSIRIFLLLTIFCAGQSVRAQTRSDSSAANIPNAAESVEQLLDQVETENEKSEIIDRLNWLQEHPFNLNTISKEELTTIPGMTPAEAHAVINLRKSLRTFRSLGQLELVEGGDQIIGKIRPYVIVEDEVNARSSINITSRTSRDLQPRKGFQDSSFKGSAVKNYNRVTFAYGDRIQSGLLFEKDAGERIGDSFLSGYLAVKDWSVFSQIVLGDYVVESGQGLVLWRSSAFGKGSEAVSVAKKTGLAAQPYRSSDEFNFLRGAAVSSDLDLGDNKLSFTVLFSRRALSASEDSGLVSSFYEEGLFRTPGELGKKSTVTEKIIGSRLKFSSVADWNIGGTLYHSSFDKPIAADRLFEFSGSSATVGGIDAEMNLGWLTPKLSQVTIFGEAARSRDGSAGIIGSLLNLTRQASVAVIYRNYSPGFTSLHSAGFGERSETKNERGFYVGADVRVTSWLHVSGYLDHFRFPWRTYDNPLPTSGRDMLVQTDARVSDGFDLSLRYSNKTIETLEPSISESGHDIRLLVDRLQQKVRLTATFQPNKRIRLRGRFETTTVNYSFVNRSERGYLLYQELQYVPASTLSAEARLIFFQTDSYNSRLYEYENDVRGVFSNPAMYGKGRRWYLLLRWKAADVVHISAKYSETQYDDRTTISSGSTEIRGDIDNRIALQVEFKL